MADTETSTRAKRKRSQISYDVEEYFEDLDMEEQAAAKSDSSSAAEESDLEDVDFGSRKKPKKRAKKQPKEKKEKPPPPFRFMDLPPELRDEIYDLALTDSTIAIVSTLRVHRRSVTRGTIKVQKGPGYYGRQKKQSYWSIYRPHGNKKPKTVSLGGSDKGLIPNLLAVSKQIRDEASSVLYKQELFFEDMAALHTFVTAIGPYNRQLLTDVIVKGYIGDSPFNYAAFCALAGCTNLRSLFLDCDIGHFREPKWLARQIYRDGRFFLEAYGAANGAFDASLDVLELAEERHFKETRRGRDPDPDDAEVMAAKREEFNDQLRDMLAPPNMKRKGKKKKKGGKRD